MSEALVEMIQDSPVGCKTFVQIRKRDKSMLSAFDRQGKAVIASEAERKDGPFYCPSCGGQVILKQGHRVVDHFVHLPDSNCAYGTRESMEHLQTKMEIYRALKMHPEVTHLMVEHHLGEVVADVSFKYRGLAWCSNRSTLAHSQIRLPGEHACILRKRSMCYGYSPITVI